MPSESPKVSVIIPSFDGYRGGNVPKLLEDLKGQTCQDFELHIVKDIRPNGRARNEGVKLSRGRILVFIDDDTRLGHNRVIENLIKPFEEDKTIGITGASRQLPPDANWFQRASAKQLPRAIFPIVDRIVDSDRAAHSCLSIPKDLYERVGGEHDRLVRGTDPDLRYRVRKAGLRVVIVPDTWFYHPLPKTLKKLVRKGFRNGMGAGWVFKNYPHLVYEVPDGAATEFVPKRSFPYRVARVVGRLILALITFKFIRLVTNLAYISGYLWGLVKKSEDIERMVL